MEIPLVVVDEDGCCDVHRVGTRIVVNTGSRLSRRHKSPSFGLRIVAPQIAVDRVLVALSGGAPSTSVTDAGQIGNRAYSRTMQGSIGAQH